MKHLPICLMLLHLLLMVWSGIVALDAEMTVQGAQLTNTPTPEAAKP